MGRAGPAVAADLRLQSGRWMRGAEHSEGGSGADPLGTFDGQQPHHARGAARRSRNELPASRSHQPTRAAGRAPAGRMRPPRGFQIGTMCERLGVSRSGYCAWRRRPRSLRDETNAQLTRTIRVAYEQSRRIDGSPRIYAALQTREVACGRHRVARLMHDEGIRSKAKRRFRYIATKRDETPAAPDVSESLPARGVPSWPGARALHSARPEIRLQSDPPRRCRRT